MFVRIARVSTAPSLSNGVVIGGNTARRFTTGGYYKVPLIRVIRVIRTVHVLRVVRVVRVIRVTGVDPRRSAAPKKRGGPGGPPLLVFAAFALVNLATPDGLGAAPILVEDGPERLVEVLAVAQE